MLVDFSMLSVGKIISGMRLLFIVIVTLNLNILLFSQSFSMKGQSWISEESSEDLSVFISQLVYIPTLSIYH